MTQDNGFYQQIANHDVKEEICNMMVDHYNFLLGLPWNTESESVILEDQLNCYKCYDV
jgi:hypothetical protein